MHNGKLILNCNHNCHFIHCTLLLLLRLLYFICVCTTCARIPFSVHLDTLTIGWLIVLNACLGKRNEFRRRFPCWWRQWSVAQLHTHINWYSRVCAIIHLSYMCIPQPEHFVFFYLQVIICVRVFNAVYINVFDQRSNVYLRNYSLSPFASI